jgi:hypothetical protein
MVGPEHQRLLSPIHPPCYGFFPWNIWDVADLRIISFGEMPIDLVAGMVALGHRIEWDYLAEFIREELE